MRSILLTSQMLRGAATAAAAWAWAGTATETSFSVDTLANGSGSGAGSACGAVGGDRGMREIGPATALDTHEALLTTDDAALRAESGGTAPPESSGGMLEMPFAEKPEGSGPALAGDSVRGVLDRDDGAVGPREDGAVGTRDERGLQLAVDTVPPLADDEASEAQVRPLTGAGARCAVAAAGCALAGSWSGATGRPAGDLDLTAIVAIAAAADAAASAAAAAGL